MSEPDRPAPISGTPYEIPREGSLGLLALGYRGLVAWRAVRGTDWIEERRAEFEARKAEEDINKAEARIEDAPTDASTASGKLPPEVLEGLSITVVSGLPRSGTSLMMQMLAAGGLAAYTDAARGADESNPRGYYEHARVKALAHDQAWLPEADGLVVKVVAPLLRHLPAGPSYRVVFVERDLDEVIRSQAAMLGRDGRASADAGALAATYRRYLSESTAWAARHPRIEMLTLTHADAVAQPAETAACVNAFLGGTLDEAAMRAAVDPSLHRQRTA